MSTNVGAETAGALATIVGRNDGNGERLTTRPSYSEKKIAETYSFNTIKSGDLWLKTRNYLRKYYTPSKDCWKRYLVARLPIIKWMRNYNVRDNLLKDTIGGLTIGVVQIPQSMGYALMAGVPPVTGLYVSFFTVIIYFFLGTCRNLSLGTYGIVSLMINSAIEKFEGKLYASDDTNASYLKNSTSSNILKTTLAASEVHQVSMSTNYLSDNPDEAKIMIATSLAFFVGIFQLALGLIHAGVVTKYLSDIIVAGFTTGAAYHIVISQLNSLVGISVKHEYSLFKITEYFIELFGNINKINWPTVIVSVVSMFELYMVKHFINQRYKDKMIAPFPIELVIVAFGTLFSYLFRFHENFKIAIVGTIPVGIPAPRMPPLWLFSQIVFESIEIAIVSFALNISMAKLFAKRYNYQIRPNQELFAYGLGNFVSCFFKGFPSCVGLSRSVILESTGSKTLLNSAISSAVVLIVIVAIGFVFKTLPISCLSAIIVIALIPMLSEVRQIVTIFKRSKVEALAWLATFLGVIILDVDFGLYIGIVFSLLLFIIQNQRARTFVMGNIPETDIYEAIDECDDAREIDGIKIIRYESSIFYANVENFTYNIIKLARVDPIEVNEKIMKRQADYMKKVNRLNGTQCSKKSIWKLIKRKNQNNTNDDSSKTSNVHDLSRTDELKQAQEELDAEIGRILHSIKIKDLIIDFSCVNLIDSMGVEAIVNLIENYQKLGIQVHLSYCKRYVIRIFNKSKMKSKINSDFIYPTTHDAVLGILKSREVMKAAKAEAAASAAAARLDGTPATISATSMTTSSVEAPSSSFSLEIEKDKYERLEGAEAPSRNVYLKKQEDYDIINEIVSAI